MLARDYRFDGKFFVGVKTTGVYCRPICPARPKRENVEFFPDARLAEKRGYRPCLRCRPECAPLSPAWSGKSALVHRALKALSESAAGHSGSHPADGQGEEAFAARFGVSARHLRRLFLAEVGKTPARIQSDHRLDFARNLILDTSLPMAGIAGSAGFASIRRFNAAVKERFRRSPTELRGRGRKTLPAPGIVLTLPFRPPFDWETSLAYYRSHTIAGLESFGDGAYERRFRWEGGAPGSVRVTLDPGPHRLRVEVSGSEIRSLARTAKAVRRMFDLDSDPLLVANAFAREPRLEKLRRKRPGLRSPRGWDPWETAVCAVLGQLVSIPQANRLIAQLVAGYGEIVRHPGTREEFRLFPTPGNLLRSDLAKVGTTGARKAVLRELARKVHSGEISLSSAQDPDAFRASLLAIRGIGPWTAEYICLRAIGDTDAFPATDLVLRRALEADGHMDISRVRPWRGYAAAHLWRAWALEKENQ